MGLFDQVDLRSLNLIFSLVTEHKFQYEIKQVTQRLRIQKTIQYMQYE